MEISVNMNFNLGKFDGDRVNQLGLIGSSTRIRTQAQDNAPYQSGKLRQGIAIEPGQIRRGATSVRVGPRKVVYAIVREFVNYKNPHRKFYMKRAFDTAPKVVQEEFEKAVGLIIKKI